LGIEISPNPSAHQATRELVFLFITQPPELVNRGAAEMSAASPPFGIVGVQVNLP
jgi:hypothetical protein